MTTRTHTRGPSTVTVARTRHEVELLRPVWDGLPVRSVDADLDYFLAVVDGDPDTIRPHVLHLSGPRGDLLVVARLVEQAFPVRLGYRVLGRVRARALVVSFEGVLGAGEDAELGQVLAALRGELRAGEADLAVLQKIDTAGAWFRVVTGSAPRTGHLVRPAVPLWTTDVPGSWEQLLAARTAKSRRQIRYDDNKLRRAYGDRLELRRLDQPAHRHRLPGDLREVAAESYQRDIGVSVLDSEVQSALLREAGARGWLRVWMLYVDQRPAAFWWGVLRHGTVSIGSPGFRRELARDRVGYYVLRRMLEDCCADPEVRRIDYGPGAADYKERFGTSRADVADVVLLAGRPRPVAVGALLAAQDRVVALAKRGLDRTGRTAGLRRRLRTVRRDPDDGAADDQRAR